MARCGWLDSGIPTTDSASHELVQAIIYADGSANPGIELATLVLALLSIAVMLCMPLRDPSTPSRDISQPFSEATSSLRSPEDDLSLWQFMTVSWMTPLIRTGSKRQLQDEDVWQLGHEFQHRSLHDNFRQLKGTVIQRLLRANYIDLFILTFLGLVELCANYAIPVLLQKLLSSMEDPMAPRRAAIVYAALSLAVRLISCQSGVFSLWFGRRCYERSRGEMITMLYEKTLGRKIAFKQEEKKENALNGHAVSGDNGAAPELDPPSKKQPTFWQRSTQKLSTLFTKAKSPKHVKEPASMGKILNLMRNDVYEVAQRFWEFQQLITKPLSCVFSIALVVNFLGWSSLLAVLVLVFCQVINAVLARIMIHYEKKRRAATDKKLAVITQFVEAIRHLRWYGWQGKWLEQIMDARQTELNIKVITNLWNLAISFVNTLGLDLTPVVAFAAYTLIAKKPLRVDVAFPAMQLFQMMTSALRDLPNLIIVIINAWVAVDRIEDFMAEPNKQEMSTEALIGDSMAIEHGTFSWPGVDTSVLEDVNVSFPPGLSVVIGEVASGKTALLQALLGELDMHKGGLMRPQDPVAYCAQTPWLQSMSIRENILFSSPYDEWRYKDVLDACALTPDLAEFKAGDLSLIGENGIGLSGGQRARVALARAVYSRNNILLLDDPLSALDQQTAEAIVQRCLAGPLMKGRTTVLVTHRTDLVLSMATQVIKIEHGTATILDHEAAHNDSLQRIMSSKSGDEADEETREKQNAAAVPDKFIEDEHRAHGGVKAKVYWEYIKAGKIACWILLVFVLALYRLVSVAEIWFIKAWGEAYDRQPSLELQKANGTISPSGLFDSLPPPQENIRPWLIVFALLAPGESVLFVLSQGIMIVIVYVAARRMFREVMTKVANATFRYYDITPVGRLMNRMTSDIGVIDGNISQRFQGVAWLGISWISSVIVIASVTPTFLAFAIVLTILFLLIFMRFLPTSQSLRRLEMVSLTPLMSNFGALLNGLTTVRAFHAQSRFQDRVIKVVDTFQKMDHFYWSLQTWLMYRYDALSAISTFVLTLLALVTNVSPGLTAFVLVAANKFVLSTHYLCKSYGALQMEFVSVERVVELLHLDQEPEGEVSPPAWWPSFSGDIMFEKVTIKYAPHLDPALNGISFTVKGGSKTAVIGRTGSGKSTLALALLATILPESGSITIDNIDLVEVDKQLLRTRVTFLAQDPVLFPGSIRENLDPVSEHSIEACELVLRRVCDRQGWDLETKIEAGGRNLSQGQRQLVGLARAVLRRSAIIILDEATASIDRETAMQIQQVMHEEMKESTVITIAHRLEAVRNADYCIVLGKGKILEQGPAHEMLGRHSQDMTERDDE
ncbi:hypothetical protein LTR78_003459 [Recurvomyces mirabilis]|uniref:ABC transporter n=1 Tax=Recurvomyces mirabilis TaxID=574656 RepID=A0AAE1C3E5_9PEZI|nr:hypothetical protein LTR78_003459 [Recurvomyces mirabilis]KAK5154507.1 hypothetical protein LTS14_006644 [Recurvomyces mirabilis]